MRSGQLTMANGEPALSRRGRGKRGLERGQDEVPIQVMVPKSVRRQVAHLSADSGENLRTIVLRGLQAIGIDIPSSELGERRGRRRTKGANDGAK